LGSGAGCEVVGVEATQVFLVRYEDLKTDTLKTLSGIVDFVYPGRRRVSEDVLLKAIEFSDFDNMRRKEKEGKTMSNRFYSEKEMDNFELIRKGEIGRKSWEECFEEESDMKFFMEDMRGKEMLAAYGYAE